MFTPLKTRQERTTDIKICFNRLWRAEYIVCFPRKSHKYYTQMKLHSFPKLPVLQRLLIRAHSSRKPFWPLLTPTHPLSLPSPSCHRLLCHLQGGCTATPRDSQSHRQQCWGCLSSLNTPPAALVTAGPDLSHLPSVRLLTSLL